jgi:glycosyltransferase involved in cell wall biosynthesis
MRVAKPIRERTAIVHDWFQGFHGSERVVDAMRTGLFAEANPPDIYTFQATRPLLPPDLAASIVGESRASQLPIVRARDDSPGHWRYLLPYMPYYFDRLRLEEYDLVISSAHAFAKRVRVRADALHVCYCYTPIRYLWLPETESHRTTGVARMALDVLRNRLKAIDFEAAQRPHGMVAISTAVSERIRRFYGRDADVIHPPVDVQDFVPGPKEAGRFLWVNRLVGYKRPELVAEAFRGLPYTLIMVGVGPLEHRLRRQLPENVKLIGWLPRQDLVKLYAEAVGFIHVGEEDFGISMVEALAAGTPVIALDAGGARDIVRPGRDGFLLDRATVDTLREAITWLVTAPFDRAALTERARLFSRDRFLAELSGYIRQLRRRVGS